jgi:hypothetical protein
MPQPIHHDHPERWRPRSSSSSVIWATASGLGRDMRPLIEEDLRVAFRIRRAHQAMMDPCNKPDPDADRAVRRGTHIPCHCPR